MESVDPRGRNGDQAAAHQAPVVVEEGSRTLELDQHQGEERHMQEEEEEEAQSRTLEGVGQKQQTVEHPAELELYTDATHAPCTLREHWGLTWAVAQRSPWGYRFIESRRAIRPSGRHTLLSPSAVLVNNARQGLTKEWIALQPQVSQGWLLFRLGIPTLALFLSDPLHDPPSS